MGRLTADLVADAPHFINPVRDRELDLRGNKIPTIENLGATRDQFDAIDLSDNVVRRLEGFPLLKRLRTLFISNNRIRRIAPDLGASLPNLEELVLTNNDIDDLSEIDHLASLGRLQRLCLLRNPVSYRDNYRLYAIHTLPQVRILDFNRVKDRERHAAAKLFAGKEGKALKKQLLAQKARTFVPGEAAPRERANGPSDEERRKIRDAIGRATTLEEVRRLEVLLKRGIVPSGEEDAAARRGRAGGAHGADADAEEEDDEDDDGARDGPSAAQNGRMQD